MGQLRDRMMHDLELAGYVPKTRLIYLNAIRDFAAHYRRSPEELGADHVRGWVGRLTTEAKVGPQRIRQHMAALKFLYTKTLGDFQGIRGGWRSGSDQRRRSLTRRGLRANETPNPRGHR